MEEELWVAWQGYLDMDAIVGPEKIVRDVARRWLEDYPSRLVYCVRIPTYAVDTGSVGHLWTTEPFDAPSS